MICEMKNPQHESCVRQQGEATSQRKLQTVNRLPWICQSLSKKDSNMNTKFNTYSERNYDPIAWMELEHRGAYFLCITFPESKHDYVEAMKEIKRWL